MTLAFTIHDCAQAINVGGDTDKLTCIMEIPDEQLPELLRKHLKARAEASKPKAHYLYETLSISLVV